MRLLDEYKLVRSPSGHMTSHINGHPIMRDSYVNVKSQSGESKLYWKNYLDFYMFKEIRFLYLFFLQVIKNWVKLMLNICSFKDQWILTNLSFRKQEIAQTIWKTGWQSVQTTKEIIFHSNCFISTWGCRPHVLAPHRYPCYHAWPYALCYGNCCWKYLVP